MKASREYLSLYGDVLTPYAYDRFDIVENWFTTGFGMPEFTLLGKHVVARMLAESARTGGIPAGYLDHEIVQHQIAEQIRARDAVERGRERQRSCPTVRRLAPVRSLDGQDRAAVLLDRQLIEVEC